MSRLVLSTAFGQDLLEDDRAYFEMGASLHEVPGAVLAVMPALGWLAAGCVVHRVRPEAIVAGGAGWVATVEAAAREAGAAGLRVYLDAPDPEVATVLGASGFSGRREIGFAAIDPIPMASSHVDICEVRTAAGWADKLAVQEASPPPDGHDDPPAAFIALEQAKAGHGLDAWVAYDAGTPVGSVCSRTSGSVLRSKNLVVAAPGRRRGVATALLAHGDRRARAAGLVLGTFAVAGSPGEDLYRASGMRELCEQVEWSRPIASHR